MSKILTLLFFSIILFGCKQKEDKLINNENTSSINESLILNDSTSIKKVFNPDEVIYIDDSAYYKKDSTLINGELISFHENGTQKQLKTFKYGILDGPRKVWNENGQLTQEGTYQNGIKNGTRTGWFDTGQIKATGTYNNGQLNGVRKSWWKNGVLKNEMIYKNGKLDGVLKLYDEEGNLKEERIYKDGKKIK